MQLGATPGRDLAPSATVLALLILDCLPLNGKLHIRERKPRPEGEGTAAGEPPR